MAGRNHLGALLESGFCKEFKFNFLVAHDIRIWRIALLILSEHIVHDFLFVFGLKIKNSKIDAELNGNAFGIGEILCPWTLHAGEILAPVFHIDTDDFVALLLQKISRNSRINATRHAKKNFHLAYHNIKLAFSLCRRRKLVFVCF